MILPLQTFTTMLEGMSAGLQGRATQLIDLSVGSVLRALLESCASIALWMQWLILQVLSMTRASTSVGADLDSWMADFSFGRLPGSASNGLVTFTRFTVGLPAFIKEGTIVLTTDGSLRFAVISDNTNPFWSQQPAGYTLPATVASITLPAQALVAGASGNVLAGTIGLLGSAIPGVDQVLNSSDFGGGVDVESDASLRTRFQLYINSRSLGTAGAIASAVSSLQQGIRYCVLENVDLGGKVWPGNFCVIVDDGDGTASSALLESASAAVDAVRPIGSTFSVTPAAVLPVTIQMSVVLSASSAGSATATAVQDAISSWVGGLPMGGLLAISKLEALAHSIGTAVLSVSMTLINGLTTDLKANPGTVFKAFSVNVSSS